MRLRIDPLPELGDQGNGIFGDDQFRFPKRREFASIEFMEEAPADQQDKTGVRFRANHAAGGLHGTDHTGDDGGEFEAFSFAIRLFVIGFA